MTERRLRVLVVGKLSDHKLRSKVEPLLALPEVAEVGVVRRTPLPLPGVRSFSPPPVLRGIMPLSELWRLFTVLRLAAGPWNDAVLVAFYLVPHGIYIEIARRLFGARTVQVTLSQSDVLLGAGRGFFNRALRGALAVGVRGGNSRDTLRAAGIPEDRLFDPPNLYDPADYAPAAEGEARDIDVLFAGNLVKEKKVDVLLHAVALVRARGRRLAVTLVGDGILRARLEALARSLGVADQVTFAGRQPAADVPRWLRRARVFVMTSEVEGLPMAMIEAMSCGVPPVVPDVGDVATVARDGENAIVLKDATPAAYAGALSRLLDDEALHARLRAGCLAARERFAADYSLAAATSAWRRALGLETRSHGAR